jgi:FK506-binding nuclear protein
VLTCGQGVKASQANGAAPGSKAAAPGPKQKVRSYPNGFIIEDVAMGRPDGKVAKPGKKVEVRYVGRLQKNGKEFDRTKGRTTFKFRLGAAL